MEDENTIKTANLPEETKQNRRKKFRRIIIVIAVALLAFILWFLLYGGVKAQVATIEKGDITEVLDGKGLLTAESSSVIFAKGSFTVGEVYFKIGDSVKAGDLLFTTVNNAAESDIGSLSAKASGLAAELELAETSANQIKVLYEEGAVSKTDYDGASTKVKKLAAELASLQYSINSAKDSLTLKEVRAPISGVLTTFNVSPGKEILQGVLLAEVYDDSTLYLEVALSPEDGSLLKEGGKVRLKDRPENIFTIGKIHPKVEERMSDLGTLEKKAIIEVEWTKGLKGYIIGSEHKLEFILRDAKATVLVPQNAVFRTKDGSFVFKVNPGGRVETVEMELGIKGKEYYQVLSGLEPGDRVVLSPPAELKDGKVIIEE